MYNELLKKRKGFLKHLRKKVLKEAKKFQLSASLLKSLFALDWDFSPSRNKALLIELQKLILNLGYNTVKLLIGSTELINLNVILFCFQYTK